jgi:hypothetical protein
MNLEITLYQDFTLSELESFLKGFQEAELRKTLLHLFRKYQHYHNLTEWNRVVRICESLAIIGWGEEEGVEALYFTYINCNPYTCFADYSDKERIQSANWSKSKSGYTLKPGQVYRFNEPNEKAEKVQDIQTDIQSGKFLTQRNWLPGNPVKLRLFVQNALPELEWIRDKVVQCRAFLNARLSGHSYGKSLNYIHMRYHISSEFTLYELTDSPGQKYAGKTVLTPKFVPGRFNPKTGIFPIDYYMPKAFGALQESEQLQQLKQDMLEMVDLAMEKLQKKCSGFDFMQMRKDLERCLGEWG